MSRKLYVIMQPRKTVDVPGWGSALGHAHALLYYIYEQPVSGRLIWCRMGDDETQYHRDAPIVGVFPKSGYYDTEDVGAEEAELITGLAAPVCFDRLRELVHES